jgi:DNA mismatch endonuclease, patch repair protein
MTGATPPRLPPTPAASSAAVRARLQRLPSRNTKPELAVRRSLHALGFRYRINARLPLAQVRRSADLIFGPAKVAVFIDGCWIHRCPEHYAPSKSNSDWWAAKIEGNERRDRDTDRRLVEIGWLPLRAWTHEPLDEVVTRIAETVLARRQCFADCPRACDAEIYRREPIPNEK